MTDAIYNRAATREGHIWGSFAYAGGLFDGDETTDRAVIFGLYTAIYKHGHAYLEDLETEELTRLVETYNTNMSQLTNEEAALVLDHAARRYIKSVDQLINSAELTTKRQEIQAGEDKLDAQIASFSTDAAELQTLQDKVSLARDRAAVRITELQALIETEDVNAAYVDLEITQKQLEAAKTEYAILRAALEALEIQVDIVNAAVQVAEIAARQITLQAEIKRIEAEIEELGLEEDRLEIDQEELSALQLDWTDGFTKRIALIQSAIDTVEAKEGRITAQEAQEVLEQVQRLALLTARTEARKQGYTLQAATAGVVAMLAARKDTTRRALADLERTAQLAITEKRNEIQTARKDAATNARVAALDAANTLANANITNTLTHAIGTV